MYFASDNWSGAAPQIAQALADHAAGYATAYGDSDLDGTVEHMLAEVFEAPCAVFFVGTGTAANSLAAAVVSCPGSVVFSHADAHVIVSEGGAPEAFTSGGRLVPVDGANGMMDPAILREKVTEYPAEFNHLGRGTMVSMTQSTEAGTVYSLDQIEEIASVAKEADLAVHMDGARFANALVALDCTPAEMTWKRGVDMVSFGGTKNGCWCAEALLVFNPERFGGVNSIKFQRKRMGHLFSKTRFISAQLKAYLENDVWLNLARHSNAMGMKLAAAIEQSNRLRLAWPAQSNQLFMIAKKDHAEAMLAKGAHFYPWPACSELRDQVKDDEQVYRFVTSFATTEADVDAFAELLAE